MPDIFGASGQFAIDALGNQNQQALNNAYGPAGFGGQTAYYAGVGADYGRATGGFNGTIDASSFPDAGLANNPYYQAAHGGGGIGSDTAHDPYAWTLAQSSPYAEPSNPPSNGPYPNLGYNPGMANYFANPTMSGADQNTYGVDPGAWASMSAGDRATFNRAMGGGTSSQPYQGNPNYLPDPMQGQAPIQQGGGFGAGGVTPGYMGMGMGIGSTGAGDANVGNTYGTSGQNPAIGGGGTAPGYGGFQGGNNPYNIPANLLGRMSQSDIMQFNNMMAAQGGAQPASMGSTNAPQYYYQPQPGADTISRTPDQLNQGTQDYNILNPNELMNRQNGTGGYPTGSRDAITQAMLGNGYYGGG